MKAIQIRLALKRKRRKIERTLVLPKRADFKTLHEAACIVFNLNGLESYEFVGDFGCLGAIKDQNHQQSSRKLLCLKLNDHFRYYYDALDKL